MKLISMVFGFMVLVLAYTVTAAPAVQAVGDQASSDAYNCYAGNSWGWFNVPLVHANAVASFIGNQGNSKSNCRVTTSDRNGCHLVAEIKGAEAWLCSTQPPISVSCSTISTLVKTLATTCNNKNGQGTGGQVFSDNFNVVLRCAVGVACNLVCPVGVNCT